MLLVLMIRIGDIYHNEYHKYVTVSQNSENFNISFSLRHVLVLKILHCIKMYFFQYLIIEVDFSY